MDLGLHGKTALVCSATSGLGRATAEALAAEGVRVAVGGWRSEAAAQLATELPEARPVVYDIAEPGAAESVAAAAEQAMGREMDIVVLNGPGPRPGGATGVDAGDLRAAVESLLIFQQALAMRVLPGMRRRGWGRILSIGSSVVAEPSGELVLSGVGRSALGAYLKVLATEVARDGVTVNMLLPGRIDTHRVRALDAARAEAEGKDAAAVAAATAAAIPAGRYGTPAEFAAVAAFLCSQQAGYVTGSAVRCDGGIVHHL